MRIFEDYLGRTVRLTDERLEHMLEHPEMAGLEAEIAKALRRPELVIRSKTDDQVELYYRLQTETIVGTKWLCIVVKYLTLDAFIITAYLTDKPKAGERLWPRN